MSETNSYVAGQVVRVWDTITVDGALTDAGGTVTVTVTKPDGTSVTGTATHDSLGRYHFDVATAIGEHGIWWYRFAVAAGAGKGAGERSFKVERARAV